MKFYHGTNIVFDGFELSYSTSHLDFGKGIYLADKYKHAKERAIQKVDRLCWGQPIVYSCQVDMNEAKEKYGLKVKVFKEPDLEWLDFVTDCRMRREDLRIKYDVIIGPTADGDWYDVLDEYAKERDACRRRRVAVPDDDIKGYINLLRTKRYSMQTCIKTERAVKLFNSGIYLRKKVKT